MIEKRIRKSKYDKIAEEIENYLEEKISNNKDYYFGVFHNKSSKSITVYFTFTLKHESYLSGYNSFRNEIEYLNELLKGLVDKYLKGNKKLKVTEDYLTKEKVTKLQEHAEDYGNDDWSVEHEMSTLITFKY